VDYAQSHQNDPLGAAVVREVIRVIREEELIERCRELAALLLSGLERIRAETGRITDVRARGLLVAIVLEDDAEASFADHVHREVTRRGFVLARRPRTSVLRVDPPLTIDRKDIEGFLETLEDVLADRPRRP
jgi:acetylornithine aminotransferase